MIPFSRNLLKATRLKEFAVGSPESRAAARARLELRSRFDNDVFSVDYESLSTGLPELDFGVSLVITPPDSIVYYEMADTSIVRVICRQYDGSKFTAFIHQTRKDGSEYHGACRVQSLAELRRIARPINR